MPQNKEFIKTEEELRDVLRDWVSHYRQSQRTGKPVSFEYLDERGDHHAWLSATVNYLGTKPGVQPRFAYLQLNFKRLSCLNIYSHN